MDTAVPDPIASVTTCVAFEERSRTLLMSSRSDEKSVLPVSYTHLDVYKRQDQKRLPEHGRE